MHLRFWRRGNWIGVRENGEKEKVIAQIFWAITGSLGLVIVVVVIDLLFDLVGVNGVVDVRVDLE